MKDSIILYTLPTCGMCRALKGILKSRKIEFESIEDVELMKEKGIKSTPTLEVDGQLYVGNDARKYVLEHLIKKGEE